MNRTHQRGERIWLWQRGLQVLFHPHGFGLFHYKVMCRPFVMQLPPFSHLKEGSSKGSVFVTTDDMWNMVNGK